MKKILRKAYWVLQVINSYSIFSFDSYENDKFIQRLDFEQLCLFSHQKYTFSRISIPQSRWNKSIHLHKLFRVWISSNDLFILYTSLQLSRQKLKFV